VNQNRRGKKDALSLSCAVRSMKNRYAEPGAERRSATPRSSIDVSGRSVLGRRGTDDGGATLSWCRSHAARVPEGAIVPAQTGGVRWPCGNRAMRLALSWAPRKIRVTMSGLCSVSWRVLEAGRRKSAVAFVDRAVIAETYTGRAVCQAERERQLPALSTKLKLAPGVECWERTEDRGDDLETRVERAWADAQARAKRIGARSPSDGSKGVAKNCLLFNDSWTTFVISGVSTI